MGSPAHEPLSSPTLILEEFAVGISGSQKTIMVGLFLALHFGATAALPIATYQA
jgi:hypothetical protein